MQKKKGRQLRYIKSKANGTTSTPLPPSDKAFLSRRLFRHINELPLYIFIDCLIDRRLSGLVISGVFTEEELAAAWFILVDQYNAAMGDTDGRLYLSLYKTIVLKEIDIKMIHDIVGVLNIVYDADLAQKLNSLIGASFKFNPLDVEGYKKMLQRCLNRSKGLQLDLDRRRLEFDTLKAKNQGEKIEPTREYFQTVLINLSDYAKYPVDDKITTFEYCERIRRLTKYLETVKR
ncbi:hypothetical protein [Puia sp.]|jgi:hypothetical protein|uniref:hypothetical protein n=1 Tax=Puia sp. TaxID=2045100 RepID=UPI002F418513